MRFRATLMLAFLVLSIPSAAAQNPTATLTIAGLPASVDDLASNDTATLPFTVTYAVSDAFVCPPDTAIAISLSLATTGAASFVTGALDATEGTVSLDQGPHPSGASDSASFNLIVSTAQITANASVGFTVTANAGASGCVPAASAPAAATAGTFVNVTYIPPPTPTPPPVEESPGFELVGALIAAAIVAGVARRKRRDG